MSDEDQWMMRYSSRQINAPDYLEVREAVGLRIECLLPIRQRAENTVDCKECGGGLLLDDNRIGLAFEWRCRCQAPLYLGGPRKGEIMSDEDRWTLRHAQGQTTSKTYFAVLEAVGLHGRLPVIKSQQQSDYHGVAPTLLMQDYVPLEKGPSDSLERAVQRHRAHVERVGAPDLLQNLWDMKPSEHGGFEITGPPDYWFKVPSRALALAIVAFLRGEHETAKALRKEI